MAARRLNPPSANHLLPRRPISKAGSTNPVPDPEGEAPPPTYTRDKSPFEHVAGTVRSFVRKLSRCSVGKGVSRLAVFFSDFVWWAGRCPSIVWLQRGPMSV